jgi:hypothetical protein
MGFMVAVGAFLALRDNISIKAFRQKNPVNYES